MRVTTRIPKIPEEDITPLVSDLLAILQLQAEEIQQLKDEIARLKGQKPKPKIKPSNLEKQTEERETKKTKKRRKKKKKQWINPKRYWQKMSRYIHQPQKNMQKTRYSLLGISP